MKPCTHKTADGTSLWEIEDRSQMRFRCQNADCNALGYRRLGAARGVRLYRCRAKACKRVAVKRGWHGLVEVFWCVEHQKPDD